VTLAGLASDGGLYVPEAWPSFTRDEIAGLAGLSYVETAVRVMLPFVGEDLSEDELRALCTQAYGRFAHAAVTPLVQLDRATGCSNCSTARRWRSRTSRSSCWACCSRSSWPAATTT
jgi:threonine synthase